MTGTLRLTKAHGLGNDFVIALASRNPGIEPSAVAAKALCDRYRGIGADGLIYGMPASEPGADVRMVLFNSDGSEAEISGNGIRCLGQAVLRSHGLRRGTVMIDAASGRLQLTARPTDELAVDEVRVEMTEVTDGPPLGPAALAYGALHAGTGSVGNPHLVLHVGSLDGIDPALAGPPLEADGGGINVHFMEVVASDTIRLVHWERGAGVTQACGSGATVASTLASRWGLVGDHVRVEMPGGMVTVEVGTPPALIGDATHIAEVEVTNVW